MAGLSTNIVARAPSGNRVRRLAVLCLLLLLLQSTIACPGIRAAEPAFAVQDSVDDFSRKYTAVTKQIMLSGIELERFSLNYRVEALKQPKFRRLRYFAAQETGAAGALAFELIGVREFGIGRHNPLQISPARLHDAFTTAGVTTVIAGSGSCLELASNALRAVQNKRHGFDPGSANKFIAAKLKHLDDLLQERELLVRTHPGDPSYVRAVAEGKVLKDLRDAFVDEYAHFHADARAYTSFLNLFYLFNIATTTVSAAAARTAYRAVKVPRLNGPTNILFIVAGAMSSVSPLLATAGSKAIKGCASRQFARLINEQPHFDPAQLKVDREHLEELLANAPKTQGSLMPSLPASRRMGIYGESSTLFRKQMDSETKVIRYFDKVSSASTLLGPVIGGLLMTQGVLGTDGYYNYKLRIKKQIGRYYSGAVVGTVGTGMAVVGTAGWLLTTCAYENHLRKNHKMPVQLIHDRLEHLDDLQKTVAAL